jgi:pyruvate,water dikinase
VLNVKGIDAVMDAIESVWKNTNTPQVESYIRKTGTQSSSVRMAVIIQEMIAPEYSGVVFTRNPVTGQDETIIEAVQGAGEDLVQHGRTPFRWILDDDACVEKPDREILSERLLERLAAQARSIAQRYAKPLDLEWCCKGRDVYWLQLREITAVHTVDVYTNIFSKEFLPGIIKPLVWSINIPLINGAWIRVLTEMLGPNDLDANRLAKAFYYRAYFNTGVLENIFKKLGFSQKTLHALYSGERDLSAKLSYRPGLRSLIYVPRIALFVLRKIRFSSHVKRFLKAIEKRIRDFRACDYDRLTEKELLQKTEGVLKLTGEISYYYLITPFIVYILTYLLRSLFAKEGLDLDALAATGGTKDLEQFDPNRYLARLHKRFRQLSPRQQKQIQSSTYTDFLLLEGIDGFKSEMDAFLERFGHVSDSGNDFSCAPWRETPELLLRIITDHDHQMNPSAAQGNDIFNSVSIPRKWLLQATLTIVRRYRRDKEAVSDAYTYSYGMLRSLFLALGGLYQKKGYLERPDDIFYLYYDEIKEIADTDTGSHAGVRKVLRRKEEILQYSDIELPGIIYGDREPPLISSSTGSFSGVATSRGYYRGRVKVINGISEYGKMLPGDILVIPYSDIGLAPLFAKAGAIISESGGILSHCSIIAREYNIPAITAVTGACSLIDNTLVAVDGYRGEVIVHEE